MFEHCLTFPLSPRERAGVRGKGRIARLHSLQTSAYPNFRDGSVDR